MPSLPSAKEPVGRRQGLAFSWSLSLVSWGFSPFHISFRRPTWSFRMLLTSNESKKTTDWRNIWWWSKMNMEIKQSDRSTVIYLRFWFRKTNSERENTLQELFSELSFRRQTWKEKMSSVIVDWTCLTIGLFQFSTWRFSFVCSWSKLSHRRASLIVCRHASPRILFAQYHSTPTGSEKGSALVLFRIAFNPEITVSMNRSIHF